VSAEHVACYNKGDRTTKLGQLAIAHKLALEKFVRGQLLVANYLYGPTLLRVFGQAAVSDISFYTLNWQRKVPINSTLPTFCAVCQARQEKNAKRSAKRDNNNKLQVAQLPSCPVAQLLSCSVARMHNARVDSFEIVFGITNAPFIPFPFCSPFDKAVEESTPFTVTSISKAKGGQSAWPKFMPF